jgi:hypothetical protein
VRRRPSSASARRSLGVGLDVHTSAARASRGLGGRHERGMVVGGRNRVTVSVRKSESPARMAVQSAPLSFSPSPRDRLERPTYPFTVFIAYYDASPAGRDLEDDVRLPVPVTHVDPHFEVVLNVWSISGRQLQQRRGCSVHVVSTRMYTMEGAPLTLVATLDTLAYLRLSSDHSRADALSSPWTHIGTDF